MHRLLFLLLLPLWFGSCSSKSEDASSSTPLPEGTLKADEAEQLYRPFLEGRIDEYLAQIESCDDKPEAYRQEMKLLHQTHLQHMHEKHGRVNSFKVDRIEPTADGRQANVFFRIDYANHRHELVLVSMIHDGNRWRIR